MMCGPSTMKCGVRGRRSSFARCTCRRNSCTTTQRQPRPGRTRSSSLPRGHPAELLHFFVHALDEAFGAGPEVLAGFCPRMCRFYRRCARRASACCSPSAWSHESRQRWRRSRIGSSQADRSALLWQDGAHSARAPGSVRRADAPRALLHALQWLAGCRRLRLKPRARRMLPAVHGAYRSRPPSRFPRRQWRPWWRRRPWWR